MEVQRKQFDFVSQALIKAISVFGLPKGTLYVQHCPMAFNNTGADWISDEKQIRNPYFGDKMMKCGIVKMQLPLPADRSASDNSNLQNTHQH